MAFNSFHYFLFLPIVYLIFYFAPHWIRWFVLLTASYLFYAFLNVPYLLLILLLMTITNYGLGTWLGQASSSRPRLALLWIGIAINLLVLIVMKYQPVRIFVAIGVSFYIFQAISYLIDIYLEIVKPEPHFGYLALYLSFFPKLLQGPIERAGDLLPQLKTKYMFNYNNMRFGMLLFAWGLFKKIVIADRLSPFVDDVYTDPHSFTGLPLLLVTYAYAFQLYMDFSGYTDMAIGCARLFNINLTQNFNKPYLSTSITAFWRRWHISLSRWMLDYIFKPLQMYWRDGGNWGTAAALMITFLVIGIWHGASWGFVIFGLLHGLYMTCSVFYKPYQKKWHKALGIKKTFLLKIWQIFFTFNLVNFALIFFRASNLPDAFYIVTHLFRGLGQECWDNLLYQRTENLITILISAALYIAIVLITDKMKNHFYENSFFRWTIYYCLVFYITLFAAREPSPFIYLRF